MIRKLLLVVSTIALLGLPLIAGGSQSTSSVKEINLFHFKVDQIEQWEEISQEYSRVNPNVKLVVETVGGASDWVTALKTRFASGSGPDIFVVDGPSLARTFDEYLTDLSDQPWVSNTFESARAPLTFDGKLMGMPFNLEGYGFIYNKEIFSQAGISTPPKTIGELRTAAEKLEAIGVTPFGNGYSEWWVIGMHLMNIPFAFQDDPAFFVESLSNGSATMAENPLFQSFQDLFDLTIEYSNANPLTTDHNAQMALFNSGEVAMVQQGNWKELDIYASNSNAEVGFLPIPINNNATFSDRLPVGVPFYWVVNNQSSVQQEALDFLNWMVTSDFGRSYIGERFGYIPAFYDMEPGFTGGLSQDIQKYAGENKTIPWNFSTWPAGMYNEFAEHTQRYVAGRLTYPEMLQAMDESWKRLSQ